MRLIKYLVEFSDNLKFNYLSILFRVLNPNPLRIFRVLGFLFLYLFFNTEIKTEAQVLPDSQVFQVLNEKVTSGVELFSSNEGFTQPLYYPSDLRGFIGINFMKDHLIKTGNGLFYIPDGTDRVYELIIEKNRPSFIRRDNSFFSGHTFHALNFSYKDSIYSFSGFGFGHHNSQLRVFNMGTGNWRSIKLNQDVAISFRSSPGVWVNTNTGKLWTISHLKTDLAQNFSAFTAENCDSIPVRYLDFSSGQWKSVGELNPVMLNTLKANTRIGTCPWGELTLDTAKLQVGLIN